MNVVPLDSIETQLLALGVPDLDHLADGVFLSGRPVQRLGLGVALRATTRRSAGSGVLVQQADGTLRVVWTYGNDPPPS